jgi:hypothetical protein
MDKRPCIILQAVHTGSNKHYIDISIILAAPTQGVSDIECFTMSKRANTFQSLRNNLPIIKRRRTSSSLPPSLTPLLLSGPSHSGSAVVPPVNADQPQPLPGPSNSGGSASLSADGDHAPQSQSAGDGNVNHFDSLLNHTDAPRTVLRDIGGVAYEGLKGVVAMADTVGYALPPLKAASAGAGRVMKVYDVCISPQQTTAQDSPLRQNVGQNKKGFEEIQDTLNAISSIIAKYKQHGSQGVPGEAVAGPSRIADYSTSVISSCSIRLPFNSLALQCFAASQRSDRTCTTAWVD